MAVVNTVQVPQGPLPLSTQLKDVPGLSYIAVDAANKLSVYTLAELGAKSDLLINEVRPNVNHMNLTSLFLQVLPEEQAIAVGNEFEDMWGSGTVEQTALMTEKLGNRFSRFNERVEAETGDSNPELTQADFVVTSRRTSTNPVRRFLGRVGSL